eukprot:TRINITY_DN3421_c3_g3_i1.p1 TRINITY_DN3421_c3_g3~~TRINITY_DN3421_c3_g3_i1.p1  ORF type:complete len:315 (+),score=105.97 TRINITY_DN3421_c3_g3_i1:62-1006(+)
MNAIAIINDNVPHLAKKIIKQAISNENIKTIFVYPVLTKKRTFKQTERIISNLYSECVFTKFDAKPIVISPTQIKENYEPLTSIDIIDRVYHSENRYNEQENQDNINEIRAQSNLQAIEFFNVNNDDDNNDDNSNNNDDDEDQLKTSLLTECNDDEEYTPHQNVVSGGTFDAYHAGHGLLLTSIAFCSSSFVEIGLTGPLMLKNKKHADMIMSYEEREENLNQIFNWIKPGIDLNIIKLADPYGNTLISETLTCIVGSEETKKGCEKINQIRTENGLCPLVIETVGLILPPKGVSGEQVKLSSSELRARKAATK